MRFVIGSALKDLRRLRRDPLGLGVWIAIPVIIGLMLTLLFGGGSSPTPRGLLLVADEDETVLSGFLAGSFDRGPMAKMITVERVERGEGRRRLDRGDGSALLIVPKGFAEAYLRNQRFELSLVTNPSQQILPQIIAETLSMVMDLGFYVQLLAGDQLRTFSGDQGALSDLALSGTIITMRHRFENLRAYVDPPVIKLKTTVVEQRATASPSFAAVLYPCLLFQSLLFVGMGLSADVWKERGLGTLRRLVSTPSRLSAALAGKLLSVTLVIAAVGVAGLAAGYWMAGLHPSNVWAALAWVVCSGAVLSLRLLLLQTAASNERAANILVNLLVMPLMMLGGTFFPFEAMPKQMAAIGRWTPNGWLLLEFKAILDGSIGAGRLAVDLAAVALLGALVFLVVARRLRVKFVV
jgi:ABC-type multidrug transport system permease subunit